MLVFAYGSNLHMDDLARYAREHGFPPPALTPLHAAWLPNRRLSFGYRSRTRGGGCLDVRPAPGRRAPGFVFRALDDSTLALIDHKEGHPDWYRRLPTEATWAEGRVEVLAWEVTPARRIPHLAPSEHYVGLVREGYRRFGLPLAELESALSERA